MIFFASSRRLSREAFRAMARTIPEDVKEKQYPNKDYHTMYIGEIVEVLSK